ncbi:MAG: HAMP domain-containing histidine kinase [Oscillospiraceae bacterium]|nr:HAMP domain-containing histidine kinase [Oscillospiraceae bacterium]
MITACIVLFLLCVWLVVYIFRLKAGMRDIKNELILTRDKEYNRQLTVDLMDDNLSEMTAEMNRNLDYQKKLKEKSEAAELSLKQSVSDIAHDLRTPLTVISGNLQMLKKECELSPAAMEYIRASEDRCRALKVMADDFFELSVLESDYSAATLEKVSFTNELMQFIVDNEAVIRANNLEPEVVFPKKTVFIMADRVLLSRMLGNLLNNVIKYAKDSFSLVLSENKEECIVTFSNQIDGERVIDTTQLFERTYRADKARSGSGAGLGLYIVKLLAEKQNAKVFAKVENNILSIGVNFRNSVSEN